MAEREFFVICNNCGSEVSPYVTECPYCGTRLRKSAPDLKKQKKVEEREERKAAKKRDRLRAQYEGGGSSISEGNPSWMHIDSRPIATIILVFAAIVASIIAGSWGDTIGKVTSDTFKAQLWMLEHLVSYGSLGEEPWKLFTAPFLQYSAGYGFVSLGVFALFGAGLEKRFGAIAVVAVWVVSGALGVVAEGLIATSPIAYGAYAAAAGAFIAWTFVVVRNEDLRDYDAIGLGAIAFVLCALPIATPAASVWSLLGGIVGGLICGAVLSRLPSRAVL